MVFKNNDILNHGRNLDLISGGAKKYFDIHHVYYFKNLQILKRTISNFYSHKLRN